MNHRGPHFSCVDIHHLIYVYNCMLWFWKIFCIFVLFHFPTNTALYTILILSWLVSHLFLCNRRSSFQQSHFWWSQNALTSWLFTQNQQDCSNFIWHSLKIDKRLDSCHKRENLCKRNEFGDQRNKCKRQVSQMYCQVGIQSWHMLYLLRQQGN